MDLKESCPSVSIPSSDEHREKKKRFTVYKVLVSVGRNEWFVLRRYAEFDKLYNTLKKQFPTMNLKIPAKRIFGDNFDPGYFKINLGLTSEEGQREIIETSQNTELENDSTFELT